MPASASASGYWDDVENDTVLSSTKEFLSKITKLIIYAICLFVKPLIAFIGKIERKFYR
jgi:hypothetical protein